MSPDALRVWAADYRWLLQEAREKQLPPPGDWRLWLLLAGRGFGKTRSVVEFGRLMAKQMPGSRGAIVGSTAADVRDVLVEGESGFLNVAPAWDRPLWEPSKRRLTFPNGTIATTYSADEPDRLRGPQHHWAIEDELAAWRYPDAHDMLMLGLRLGKNPRSAIATTPRPIPLILELLENPDCVTVRGTTYENRANLADAFFSQIIRKYEGTRLGAQELEAEILMDVPGALWTRLILEETRVTKFPDLERVVIAVDPPATTGTCGIVAVGSARVGGEPHGYTLGDESPPAGASPAEWGAAIVAAYHKYRADYVVGEINNGGAMVEHVLRTAPGGRYLPFKAVHASRGKQIRAQPVSSVFEQGRGHLVGYFRDLENQLCSWVPGDPSPDRLDAMVWGYTELVVGGETVLQGADNPFYE